MRERSKIFTIILANIYTFILNDNMTRDIWEARID